MPSFDDSIASLYATLYLNDKPFQEALGKVEKSAVTSANNIATGFAGNLSNITKNVQAMGAAWFAVPTAINQSMQAIHAMVGAVKTLAAQMQEGAEAMRIDQLYNNTLTAFGRNAKEMEKELIEATGRTVDETQLKHTAMLHTLRGLTQSQMVSLAKAADIYAKTTGQSTGAVFEQLANASELLITRQLQRLRIVTRTESADISKAISQGLITTADVVNEISRKSQIWKQAMKPEYDWKDAMDRFFVSANRFGESLSKIAALFIGPLLEAVTPFLDAFNTLTDVIIDVLGPAFKSMMGWVKEMFDTFRDMRDMIKDIAKLLPITATKGTGSTEFGQVAPAIPPAGTMGAGRIEAALEATKKAAPDILARTMMPWPLQVLKSGVDYWKAEQKKAKDEVASYVEQKDLVTIAREQLQAVQNAKYKLEQEKALHAEKMSNLKAYHDAELAITGEKNKRDLAFDQLQETNLQAITERRFAREQDLSEKRLAFGIKEAKQRESFANEEAKRTFELQKTRDELTTTRLEMEAKEMRKVADSSEANKANQALQALTIQKEVEARMKRQFLDQEYADQENNAAKLNASRRRMEVFALKEKERAAQEGIRLNKEVESAQNLAAQEAIDWQKVQNDYAMQRITTEEELRSKTDEVQRQVAAGLLDEYSAKKQILDIDMQKIPLLEKSVEINKAHEDVLKRIYDQQGSAANRSAWEQAANATATAKAELEKYLDSLRMTMSELERMRKETIAIEAGPVSGTSFLEARIRQIALFAEKMEKAGYDEVTIAKMVKEKRKELDAEYYGWWADKSDDAMQALEARFRQMVAAQRTMAAQIADAYAGAWDSMFKTFEDILFDGMMGKFKTLGDYMNAFAASVNRIWAKLMSDIASDYLKKKVVEQFDMDSMFGKPKEAVDFRAEWAALKKQQQSMMDSIGWAPEGHPQTHEATAKAAADVAGEVADAIKETPVQNVVQSTVQNSVVTAMEVATLNVANIPQLDQALANINSGSAPEANVVESSGFGGALSSMWTGIKEWFGGLNIFHEGGIVGATSDATKLNREVLRPNEELAVLEKGEIVIPKGGLSDFVDKFARAAGGPVTEGGTYLVGERGAELFAPQHNVPMVSTAATQAAEEAHAAKYVAALEAKDLARYKEEFDKYRKYELDKAAWDAAHQKGAQEQPEGGGLMSMLPTVLMVGALQYGKDIWNWGKGLLGMGEQTSILTAGETAQILSQFQGSAASLSGAGGWTDAGATLSSARDTAAIAQRAEEIRAMGDVAEGSLSTYDISQGGLAAYQTGTTGAAGVEAAEAASIAQRAEEIRAVNDLAGGVPVESAAPWMSYLGPALAGFGAGSLSKGVKEIGDIATLGGWLSGGNEEVKKRYGGALAGAGAGALSAMAAGAAAGSVVPGVGTAIGAAIGALAGYISQGGNLGTILSDVWTGVSGVAQGAWGLASGAWEGIKSGAGWVAEQATSVWNTITSPFTSSNSVLNPFGGNFLGLSGGAIAAGRIGLVGEHGREIYIPRFAAGGVLSKGTIGLVGENGPEFFVPQVSGTVIPNEITEKVLAGVTGAFDQMAGFIYDMGASVPPPATREAGYQATLDRYGGAIPLGMPFEPGFLEWMFNRPSTNTGMPIAPWNVLPLSGKPWNLSPINAESTPATPTWAGSWIDTFAPGAHTNPDILPSAVRNQVQPFDLLPFNPVPAPAETPAAPTLPPLESFFGGGGGGFIGQVMSAMLNQQTQTAIPPGMENYQMGPLFAQALTPMGFAAGGAIRGGQRAIVGESGREIFISDGTALPRYHDGGVVGGGKIPIRPVPNQVVNVTNNVAAPPQQPTPVVAEHNVSINVQALDGADAYRVLSANRDALASIFSEMRFDNNSRLRR